MDAAVRLPTRPSYYHSNHSLGDNTDAYQRVIVLGKTHYLLDQRSAI